MKEEKENKHILEKQKSPVGIMENVSLIFASRAVKPYLRTKGMYWSNIRDTLYEEKLFQNKTSLVNLLNLWALCDVDILFSHRKKIHRFYQAICSLTLPTRSTWQTFAHKSPH